MPTVDDVFAVAAAVTVAVVVAVAIAMVVGHCFERVSML